MTRVWRKVLPRLPARFQWRLELTQCERRIAELYRDIRGASEESGEVDHIMFFIEGEESWLSVLRTREYRRKAYKYDVGFPTDASLYSKMDWDWDHAESSYLTPAGMEVVRNLIRAEEKHRREVAGFWLAAITGTAGTFIGLISVLKDAFK